MSISNKQFKFIRLHTSINYTDEHLHKATANLTQYQFNYIKSLIRQFQNGNPVITGIKNNKVHGREIYLFTDYGAFHLQIPKHKT